MWQARLSTALPAPGGERREEETREEAGRKEQTTKRTPVAADDDDEPLMKRKKKSLQEDDLDAKSKLWTDGKAFGGARLGRLIVDAVHSCADYYCAIVNGDARANVPACLMMPTNDVLRFWIEDPAHRNLALRRARRTENVAMGVIHRPFKKVTFFAMAVSSDVILYQRYRRDRRVLIEYILNTDGGKQVILPPGCSTLQDVELEQISVDYLLTCIRKGHAVDIAEAQKRYHDELDLPPSTHTEFGEVFYLTTHAEESGPPPPRPPPPTPPMDLGTIPERMWTRSSSESNMDSWNSFGDGGDAKSTVRRSSDGTVEVASAVPPLGTSLTEDDLRESAYELLVGCISSGGITLQMKRDEKKRKKMSFKKKLSRRLSRSSSKSREPGVIGLISIIRVQMEISEKHDSRIRDALLKISSTDPELNISKMVLPLELLQTLGVGDFSSKREYLHWERRQLAMLEEGLLLHPLVKVSGSDVQAAKLKTVVSRLEEAQEMPAPVGPAQHVEGMRMLRSAALYLAKRSAPGDSFEDEICHWADGFPLGVRLYEKLLSCIFDILDETMLVDEVEEILELLRSSVWRVLGITHMLHDICYAWVFFKQFVHTKEDDFLQAADQQLRAVVEDLKKGNLEGLSGQQDVARAAELVTEAAYLKGVLLSMKGWIDQRFVNYHHEFPKGNRGVMDTLLSIGMLCTLLLFEGDESEQVSGSVTQDAGMLKQAREYIISSVQSAYTRVRVKVDNLADKNSATHMLALLAREVFKIAEAEAKEYIPIMSKFEPHAGAISASLLHGLYRQELKPFLEEVSYLTDDARDVLPAADSLEAILMEIAEDAVGSEIFAELICYDGEEREARTELGAVRVMDLFEVDDVSGTLVMSWVNNQVNLLSDWLERTLNMEAWEPVAMDQNHSASAVEAIRLIEEVLDQFFNLKLPVTFIPLKCIASAIDKGLQIYATRIAAELGPKEDMLPVPPPLTRYKKSVIQKLQVVQKGPGNPQSLNRSNSMSSTKKWDGRLPDDKRVAQIEALALDKLYLRINSMQYLIRQLPVVERRTRDRWGSKREQYDGHRGRRVKLQKEEQQHKGKRSMSIDLSSEQEEILRLFDGARAAANASINDICAFTGYKIIFWNMKKAFTEDLYYLGVRNSRISTVIRQMEKVLSQLVDIVHEDLRDRVVAHLMEATLEAFLRVLLEGGPGRVFAIEDGDLLEEDLNILRDFFMADGDGLPRSIVDEALKPVRRVLALFSLETDLVIGNLKAASMMNDLPELVESSWRLPLRSWSAQDSRTLLRVLCHRADYDASKFLKRTCKLPKMIQDNTGGQKYTVPPVHSWKNITRVTTKRWINRVAIMYQNP
ncbi:hypothetical protein CBR_g23529 [Chara braunii]|uniref:MHD1 domain-containing protein n=1 Tax=Chara braunii TaxID=69332 RepID=A0A388L4S9_CHABU|nr:hypothetical protein CBR_g23529 [Chara braunii]|eukprot:GBG77203.1 hypothetical protein CBR_g23529 [Chara braunii]